MLATGSLRGEDDRIRPKKMDHSNKGAQQQHEEKQIVGNAIQPSQVDRLESHQSSLI